VTLCVLDASIVISWVFEDESSPYAEEIIEALKSRSAVVPLVWPLEVDNAILAAVRRRRIQEADAFRFLTVLDTLTLEIDLEVARQTLGQRILGLSLTHGLSAYDASYLELAMRRGLPLATQDERLIRAAGAAGIDVLQP
jgi:predicted nucleic acid-binding protein